MMMTWPKKSLSGVSRTHNNGRHVAGSVEWRSISAAPRDTKGPIIPAFLLLCFALASAPGRADASWPAIPPALAQPQGKVVSVRTEPELQAAVANLASGTTILVAPGTYRLTRTLAVAGALEDVAIRGAAESRDEVVLVGAGRDNASYGNVPHGIWVSGNVKRLLVANLTIRDVYYHPICVNPGPQALRFYNVRLANGGQQLLKSNPNADGSGANDTVVEYPLLEDEPTSRDTYANAIDVHGGARWTIRNNVIRNVRAPGGRLAGPAVLLWNHSADMVVEGNTFVNCQREIALGLVTRPDGHDNLRGVVRNNFIYREPGLAGGDVAIGVFDSPGSQVLHNTILVSGAYPNAIEYRFEGTTGAVIANNLTDRAIAGRDRGVAEVRGNDTSARPELFLNPSGADLRLLASATRVMDKARPDPLVPNDWDGRGRPAGPASDLGASEWLPGSPPAAPKNMKIAREQVP